MQFLSRQELAGAYRMPKPHDQVERRKEKRLKVEEGAFVFFGSKPTMSGKITDISRNGLGFSYLASKRRTNASINLTLISIPHSFRFESLAAVTVTDFKIPGGDFASERRCGVRFDQLNEDQKAEIEEFAKCCTLCAVKNSPPVIQT
jgi:c-di-GMP-binding flagellar brake protein YcgR